MPSLTRNSLSWQGRSREFLLHVPRSLAKPAAVVLVFHGAGSHAEAMIDFTGMSEQAEESGFIVVYPQGSGRIPSARTWNTGAPFLYATRQGVDDVGFVRELLRDLPARVGFPVRHVFAAGMSNGASFCFRLANALPGLLVALGTVAGCPLEAPTAAEGWPRIIHFHGTDDRFVPYAGGRGPQGFTRTVWPSVEESLAAWVPAEALVRFPGKDWLPDLAGDGMAVRRLAWGHEDAAAAAVVLYTICGGGHTWPGRQPLWPSLGRATRQVQATPLIWDFFARSLPLELG